jgi:hypothetical protein
LTARGGYRPPGQRVKAPTGERSGRRWLRWILLLLPLLLGGSALIALSVLDALGPDCIVNFRDPVPAHCNGVVHAQEDVLSVGFVLTLASVPLAAIAWARSAVRWVRQRRL